MRLRPWVIILCGTIMFVCGVVYGTWRSDKSNSLILTDTDLRATNEFMEIQRVIQAYGLLSFGSREAALYILGSLPDDKILALGFVDTDGTYRMLKREHLCAAGTALSLGPMSTGVYVEVSRDDGNSWVPVARLPAVFVNETLWRFRR